MTLKGAEQELLNEINRLAAENARLGSAVGAVEKLCDESDAQSFTGRDGTLLAKHVRTALRPTAVSGEPEAPAFPFGSAIGYNARTAPQPEG